MQCHSQFNRPLDAGSKILYKAYFPHLNVDTARETSIATQCYNCIAWTLGITDDWIWPEGHGLSDETSTTVADFDDFYKQLGYKRNTKNDATIAIFEKKSTSGKPYVTHGSVIQPTHRGRWESKLGAFIRMQHDEDSLVGNQYGNVLAYYKKDHASTQHFLNKRQKLLNQRQSLTHIELNKINQAVNKLPLATKKQFSSLYEAWKAAWFLGDMALNSNPAARKHNIEYQKLLAMGEQILPLIVSRMVLSDNFMALQLYDDLQKQQTLKVSYNNDFDVLEGEVGRSLKTVKIYASST